MAKDSFILYLDQQEIFEFLTDEQAGQLIKGIFLYERTGEIPNFDRFLTMAFLPIMNTLDRNRNKYNKIVERNKANIKSRWQKVNESCKDGLQDNTKNTTGKNGTPKIPEDTKNTDSDSDSVSVNDSDSDSVIKEKINKKENAGDSCVDGLQSIIDFYNDNVGSLTPYGLTILEDYLKELPQEVIIFAMQISVEADKRSIKYIKAILNNWINKGIKTLVEAQKESQGFRKVQVQHEETAEEQAERYRKEWGLSDDD